MIDEDCIKKFHVKVPIAGFVSRDIAAKNKEDAITSAISDLWGTKKFDGSWIFEVEIGNEIRLAPGLIAIAKEIEDDKDETI